MALEVGSVVARLEARFDDASFARFDRRLDKARRDARAPITATGKVDVDESGFRRLNHHVDQADKSSRRLTGGLTAAGVSAFRFGAASAGVAGVAIAIGKAGGAAIGFQKTMSEVAAVTGASKKELDQLSDAAINLGTKTGLGAGKAAQAISELAKGGLSTAQIIKGGLAGAMSLAAAGGLELADAATATANALNLFHLNGDQATHIADAFATAANATTADVGNFALALSQGGAAAKAAGLSFDQTTLALEALAANGVKGSDAGTSLKSALTQIASPTKQSAAEMDKLGLKFFDAHGRMKDLSDISAMLQDKLGGMTKQQRLQVASTVAGTDGMRALLALYDTGPAKLDKFAEGLKKHGTAAEVAAEKQDNFAGGMAKLSAAFEGISVKVGNKVLPALGNVAAGFAALISGQGGSPGVDSVRERISGLFDGILHNENVEHILGNVARYFRAVWDAARQAGDGIAKAFAGVGPELGIIGRAIAKVADVFSTLFLGTIKRALPGIVAVLKGLATTIRGVIDIIAGILTLDFGRVWDGVKRIFGGGIEAVLGIMRAATAPMREVAHAAFGVIGKIAGGVWDGMVGGARKALDLILGYFTTLAGAWSSVLSALSHVPGFGWAKDAARKIDDARDAIDKFRASLRKTDDDTKPMTKAVAEAAGRATELRDRLKHLKKGTEDYRTTARELKRAQGDLNKALAAGDGAGRKGARGLGALGDGATAASDAVANAAEAIRDNVNALAKGLGAKGIAFTVAKTKAGRRRQSHTFGALPDYSAGFDGYAGGGWIGRPGEAGADTVPALLGRGEAVLNRHQQPIVDAALSAVYGMDLDDLFATVTRPHYLARGGRVRRFAEGGKNIVALGRKLQAEGYQVGEHPAFGGVAPVHAHYGAADHYHGGSLDINADGRPGGEAVWLDRLARRLAAAGWHYLWRVAGHFDHLHVDIGGGGTAAGFGQAPTLDPVNIGGPAGALLRIARGATSKLNRAGQAYLDRAAGSMSGTGGVGRGASSGIGRGAIGALWRGAGGAAGATRLATAIALAESSGVPSAMNVNTNGSIDRGLWQINSVHGALSTFDPHRNAAAAVRISGNGRNWNPWTTYKSGAYRAFLARGGFARFDRGGVAGGRRKKHKLTASPLEGARSYIKAMAPVFFDENRDYDHDLTKVDRLNTTYGIRERRFDLSDEELVTEDGNIDKAAIEKRAGELEALLHVRRQILATLRHAAKVVRRTIKSYQATLRLLHAELGAAKGKDRRGLRALIDTYEGRLGGWRGKLRELTGDLIPNAKLDRDYLAKEKAGVLGTKAEATTDDSDVDGGFDVGPDDLGSALDTDLTGDTTTTEVQLPPSPEQIAAAAAAQIATSDAARAELFGSSGANFLRPAQVISAIDRAAGAKFYGAGSGGTDGGVLAGAGAPSIEQHNHFYGPAPADPHVFTQTALHEIKAAV